MVYVYFILAILFLAIAHYIKIVRQSQFIEIYEQSPKAILSKALSITFILNLIIPFKLGNVFRVVYSGRHMKNGKSFSLATVLIDILLDFFTIAIAYTVFYFIGKDVSSNFYFYIITCGIIILVCIILLVFKNFIKKTILRIAGIFNDNIELKFLKTIWYAIISFKDMLKRVNKAALFFNTITSFAFYSISYYFLHLFFYSIKSTYSFVDIFNIIYGRGSLFNPTIFTFYQNSKLENLLYLLLYFIVPIIIIYLSSYFYATRKKTIEKKKYIELFPQVKSHDRLVFLEKYFSAEKGQYIENYLKLNRDVAIIEDYSAGSNATTMLCTKDGQAFYRKYSMGKDAEKLYQQVEWIKNHSKYIKLTEVYNVYYKDGICSYDMPYVKNAVSCFNYVHTMPFEDSWRVIKLVLNELDNNLHKMNYQKSDLHTVKLYIKAKVNDNLDKIRNGFYIKPLIRYDEIYINGKKYHNLDYFVDKYLNEDHLSKVFSNDFYSDIHGDFTIENIICLKDKPKDKKPFYIIDPNTGNVHSSPYLDFAKLLQSIHGGYEFLMNTKSVQSYDNQIDFLFTKSKVYDQLLENVIDYLEKKFGKEGLKSIFYHEVIHWIRLLPYKINKIGEKSLLFYAGLIMVMSDVEKRFEK